MTEPKQSILPISAAPSVGPEAQDGRVVWFVLGLLTVLAAGLRLPFLSHQSLWFDETFTRSIVGRHGLASIWHGIESTESTPPLYYVVAKLLTDLVGSGSAAVLRLPAALAGTAAVPVAYLAVRRWIGVPAAVATAAFVAVNPMLVSYSTDARSYGLLVLTGLLTVWGLSAVLTDGSARAYAGWAAASVLCVWTHYFGALTVLGELLVLLVARPDARRTTVGWSVVVAACAAPLFPLLVHQNHSQDSAFIAALSLTFRVDQAVRQFGMGPNVPRTWLEAIGLLTIGAAALIGAAGAARRPGPRILLAVAAVTAVVPLIAAVVGLEDRFYARNLIVAVPLIGALAAPALLRGRAAPLVAYVLFATLASLWVATDWRYEQADWATAIAKAEATNPQAPVITVGAYSRPVAVAYLHRGPAAAPILTTQVLIIVQPYRGTGDRALVPAPIPASVTTVTRAFATVHETVIDGFRIVTLSAPHPAPLTPGQISGTTNIAVTTLFPSR